MGYEQLPMLRPLLYVHLQASAPALLVSQFYNLFLSGPPPTSQATHYCPWVHTCSYLRPLSLHTTQMTRCTSQGSSCWRDFLSPPSFKAPPSVTVMQLPSMFSLYPHAEVTHAHSQLGIFLLSLLVIWEPSHMAIGQSWCMGEGVLVQV